MIKQLTELMVLTGIGVWGYVAYLGIRTLLCSTLTC